MKTNIFDFKRVGLLFQRYFTERSNTELIYWSIMAIVFMLIRNVTPLMVILIIVAGAFYAGRFFREIHSRSNGVAYFMIPATQLEKLVVGIVMTTFYYFAMMMIAYVAGNLLGTFINNMLASVDFIGLNIFHHIPLQWKLFEATIPNTTVIFNSSGIPSYQTNYISLFNILVAFLLVQSIYLFGSIYFKSNQTLKTFLAVNVIQILLVIVLVIEVRLITGGFSINMTTMQSAHDFGEMVRNIVRPIVYLLPPFFWVVSYFRLTEKQV